MKKIVKGVLLQVYKCFEVVIDELIDLLLKFVKDEGVVDIFVVFIGYF